MLNVKIVISKNMIYEELKIADSFDDGKTLKLTFKTEDSYLAFINNPKLCINDFNLIEGITDINQIECILNNPELKDKILSSKPVIEIIGIKDIPKKLLKTHKKISLNLTSLSFNEILEIITHPDIHENVTFFDKYNESREITLNEMLEMYSKLLNDAQKAISNGYSQAECCFYIYNLIKKHIYHEEKENEKASKSRSIIEILKGDKIVCTGYSNLFIAIADILNIHAEACSWEPVYDDNSGHSSVVVYLNDPKYNLCGIYAIDTTWDSRKNEQDTEYENNIKHFLVPMTLEEKCKRIGGFKPSFGCSYYRFFIAKITYDKSKYFEHNKNIAYKKAKQIFNYLNLSTELSDLEETSEKIKSLGNRAISPRTLKGIITTVTPKSQEDLEKTIDSSIHKKAYEDLLIRILNTKEASR